MGGERWEPAENRLSATSSMSSGTGRSGASGGTPVVAVQNLTKVFKDFWLRDRARAVQGVSFEIYPGEIFGLLGPNGSGKSTTIKILLGLLKPTSGRVSVFGKLPTDVATKRRIGYLPEESYLYQFLNARETLDYYGKLFELDYRTRQKRIEELLDMIGLTGAQYRPVREYSKGMQRRIGIAQALINDPDFLILDEPTTGLDPVGTRQVKDLILSLGRRGKTILLSSHLLADVEDCVTRMIVLYGGQKREEGTCDSLLEKRDRMSIELEALDENLVSEIDELVRRRTNGERSILRVSKPQQRLEDFFLGIVERARQQQVATSGATSDGETAAFLRADEPQGEKLIEQLVRSEPEQAAVPLTAAAQARADEQRVEDRSAQLIESLVAEKPAAAPSQMHTGHAGPGHGTPAQAPAAGSTHAPAPRGGEPEVDLSVIDSLLGGKNSAGEDEKGPGVKR